MVYTGKMAFSSLCLTERLKPDYSSSIMSFVAEVLLYVFGVKGFNKLEKGVVIIHKLYFKNRFYFWCACVHAFLCTFNLYLF